MKDSGGTFANFMLMVKIKMPKASFCLIAKNYI